MPDRASVHTLEITALILKVDRLSDRFLCAALRASVNCVHRYGAEEFLMST